MLEYLSYFEYFKIKPAVCIKLNIVCLSVHLYYPYLSTFILTIEYTLSEKF